MPRRGTRADQSGDGDGSPTRERILDVALDLFNRRGYAETSLREIAAELRFSKAALYYHFESKQDILTALHLRVHEHVDGLLPLLQAQASADDIWEQFVDRMIGLALQNRRLLEMHIRNNEAIAELHRDPARQQHGRVLHRMDQEVLGMLRDPTVPAERRIRRMASVGAVAGVLLAASAIVDVTDAELEAALHDVVHDVLRVAKDVGAEAQI